MVERIEKTITNEKGEQVSVEKYDKVYFEGFVNGYAIVYLKGKAAFINEKGEEICPFKYDTLWPFRDKDYPTRVRVNGKLGLMDRNGMEITPIKYSRIDNFSGDCAYAECGKDMFYISKEGKEQHIRKEGYKALFYYIF